MDRKIEIYIRQTDGYILTVHEWVYVHVEDRLGDGQEGEQINGQKDRQIYSNRP